MAEVAYVDPQNKDDLAGSPRPGEPLPRPYVTTNSGTVMPYKEWYEKGMPS